MRTPLRPLLSLAAMAVVLATTTMATRDTVPAAVRAEPRAVAATAYAFPPETS